MHLAIGRALVLALALITAGGCAAPASPTPEPATATATPKATEIGGALAITSPSGGATVTDKLIVVTGTAPAGARIVQDISFGSDQETTATADGTWELNVKLDEGYNLLTFRIGDYETSAVTLAVTYDTGTASATEPPVAEPTVDPAEEPSPTAEPNPFAFPVVTLKGRGDKIVRFKIPEDLPAIAVVSERGSSNFIVWSLAADGSENDLIVNEIGSYSGTHLFDASAGTHSVAFKVESNGTWTIKIKPVTSAVKWDAASKFTGKRSNVLWVTGEVGDFFVTRITHRGTSNFIVHAYSLDDTELLVNEIGNYTGEQILPVGTILIEVIADGTWTFLPQ